jgi:RHS repeat-associated protein
LPDNTGLRPKTTGTVYGDNVSNTIDKLVEKTSYTYDGFNRLKKTETVKNGIRTTVDFTYNGDDLRVSKTVKKSDKGYQAEVTNYLYDRQNVILETDASSNVKARYIKGINYISKADAAGKESYFLYNGHGDVVQTVDAAGTVQNQYDYDIWGNPTLTVETTSNAIRYTGEFYDEETGLYYLRARYYDPNLGRFTIEDSYWGEDNNPLSLNLYTYCHNDPVNFIDPSGHLDKKMNKKPELTNEIRRKDNPSGSSSSSGSSGKSSGSGSSSSSSSSSSSGSSSKGKFEPSNEIRRPVYSNNDDQTSYLLEYGSFNLKGNFKHNDDNLIIRPSLGFDKIVKPNQDEVLINRSHEYDDQVLVRDYLKNNFGINDSDIYFEYGFVNIYNSLIQTETPLIIDGLRINEDRAYATPESINRAVQAYINSFDEIQKGVNDALLANKMDNKDRWNYRAEVRDTFAVALDLYSKGMISANEMADIYGYVRAFSTIDFRIANNNLINAINNLTDATLKEAEALDNYNKALIKQQQAMDDYLLSLKQYRKMQEDYKAKLTEKLDKTISNIRIVSYNCNEITVTDGAGNVIEHRTLQVQGIGNAVSLDEAVRTSFNSAWDQNLANDTTPYAAKQLLPSGLYNLTQAPGMNQTLNTVETMYGKDYKDAVVQRNFDENMQIANGLLFVASLGADFMAAVQYNNNLQAEINAANANASKLTPKINFYVTPKGDVVPATESGFNYNLSKMIEQNGKYVGVGSNGPVRVRVEDAHTEKPSFSGQISIDHDIPHVHVEYRQNGDTGPWGSNKTTFPQDWLK